VRSSTNIERPIRAQVVLGVAVALVLLAVPLYLLRRPSAPTALEPQAAPDGFSPSVPASPSAAAADERLVLGPVVRLRCGSAEGAALQEGRLCDQLPYFEEALAQAIRETTDCAPQTGDQGTLNYVLKIDFNQKRMHVFPGASGTWTGPQARRATKCVKQALPGPDWAKLDHKFRFYELALLATYRSPAPGTAPLFE
jgi:hypothetical protein